jgi:HPt (histidine-containing phosphotransfer) domain-containing protein
MVLFTCAVTIYGIWHLGEDSNTEVTAMGDMITRELFEYVPEMNFNTGYRYFLGNMENYIQAMLSTLKSMKAKLPILESMYHTAEYAGLRTITQTLQRMMSNIGAEDIAELSYLLETALLNERNEVLSDLLGEYIRSLSRFTEHLEDLFKELDIKRKGKLSEEQTTYLNYDFTKTKESIKLSSGLLERKII